MKIKKEKKILSHANWELHTTMILLREVVKCQDYFLLGLERIFMNLSLMLWALFESLSYHQNFIKAVHKSCPVFFWGGQKIWPLIDSPIYFLLTSDFILKPCLKLGYLDKIYRYRKVLEGHLFIYSSVWNKSF